MSRRYHKKAADQAGLIIVVLLAGTVWAHRAFMLRVEHIGLVVALVISGLLYSLFIFTFIRRLLHWHSKHSSS